ncbi:hypothetical protein V1511DRAFT_489143 [Dipodascopsis uninucleata]
MKLLRSLHTATRATQFASAPLLALRVNQSPIIFRSYSADAHHDEHHNEHHDEHHDHHDHEEFTEAKDILNPTTYFILGGTAAFFLLIRPFGDSFAQWPKPAKN